MESINIFWFRRDLRLSDNCGFFHALNAGKRLLPIFIFDTEILDDLENKEDRRVDAIFQILEKLNDFLSKKGKSIQIFYGKSLEIFQKLSSEYRIEKVFCNEDYEPYAISRDEKIKEFLETQNTSFHSYKDQVIFHKNEITKSDGKAYSVYTPYARQWLEKWANTEVPHYPSEKYLDQLLSVTPSEISLKDLGFEKTDFIFRIPIIDENILSDYHETRNFPYYDGTSSMSIHLRFGTVSIRKLAKIASQQNLTYLKELIWREFFMQILWHYPTVVHRSFKPKYDLIPWENSPEMIEKWKLGKTGYPIVDAGMRELNATGLMHNRVRMITASFLVKHLLTDWRIGEAYFAEKLMDYDLSANNGNWQWVSGSGCDSAPYFRIFNPWEQQKKFDPDFQYIRKWVPEFNSLDYHSPIIDHQFARNRTLEVFQKALQE